MRHDEPATMMHLIRPLLLLLGVLALLLIVEQAMGDTVRVYDVAGSDGPEVLLSQVAELDGEHASTFGSLVVGRFEDGQSNIEIDTASVIEALRSQDARMGLIDFMCFGRCTVHRTYTEPQRVEATDTEPAAANFDARSGEALTLHSPTTVRSLIERRVAQETGIGQASLAIEFEDRDAQLLGQSAVAGRFDVEPTSPVALGRVTFRVQGYEGTQKQGTAQTISAKVRQRVIAVIATEQIERGELITRRRVRLSEVLIEDVKQDYLQETALVSGQVASTTIRPGQLVTASEVQMPIVVKRRQWVTVVMEVQGVKITFNGVAQDEGAVGELIEVERTIVAGDKKQSETYQATVVGPGKVMVGDQAQATKGQQ